MTARIAWFVCIAFSLILAANLHAQSRLQSVREQVRAPRDEPDDDSHSHHEEHHHCDDDDDDDDIFGDICLGCIALLVGEFPEPDCYLRFARHPYQNGYPAYMIYDALDWPDGAPPWSRQSPPKSWSARVSIEDGDNFTDLNRLHGELFLENSSRLGILTRWNHLHERLPNGSDSLLFGDTTLTWRVTQSETAISRIGVGMTVLDDCDDTHLGMTFLYGVDMFPIKPIVCTGTLEGGFIGDANFFHARGTIGVTRKGCELFTGYDYLNIGGVPLQGPLVGLRFWF